jgi:serine/threonine protein kinase
LGQGNFSRVVLVEHRVTKERYALKVSGKDQVVYVGEERFRNEKETLEISHHPLIVELYQTMQDDVNLYFLLQPIMGGGLDLMIKRRKLKEDEARFYVACLVDILDHLHSQDVLYRDIKPENVLLDEIGYPHLTDFGFAKRLLKKKKTKSLLGTPEYLSPEIVKGKRHGKATDIWSLGVLTYYLCAGQHPFQHENPQELYRQIISKDISCPSHFSSDLKDLLSKMLHKVKKNRLRNAKGVKAHRWFAAINFDDLRERKITAPRIPIIKLDLSHLRCVEDRRCQICAEEAAEWECSDCNQEHCSTCNTIQHSKSKSGHSRRSLKTFSPDAVQDSPTPTKEPPGLFRFGSRIQAAAASPVYEGF